MTGTIESVGGAREAIRQFILANYLPGESPDNLLDTTPLQTSGLLDSLAVLSLAEFVERTYGVELSGIDTVSDQFDRIADIANLIARKRAF